MFGHFGLLERRVAYRISSSLIRVLLLAHLLALNLCFQAQGEISLETYKHSNTITSTANGFEISGQLKPNLTLYENNHYLFAKSDTNTTLFYISDSIGSTYGGSDVFNNGLSSLSEYLLLSPNTSTPILHYYDPGDTNNSGQITFEPYQKLPLQFPDIVNQEASFGISVVIDESNQTIVGAHQEDDKLGKIYLLDRLADLSVNQVAEISPPENLGRMSFGSFLASSGTFLAVGAPDTNSFQGKVYLYEKTDGNYSIDANLSDPNGQANDTFGSGLSLHGTSLVVSSPQKLSGLGPGKVILFERNSSTSQWDISKTFWSDSNQTDEYFGNDLALSSNYLLIGAPREDDGSNGTDSGAAYLFEKNSTTQIWSSEATRFSPSSLSPNDEFGHSVALWDNYAFIGAKNGGDSNDTGVVYVFEKEDGMWNEKQKIDPPTGADLQNFSQTLVAYAGLLGISSPGAGEDGMIYLFEKENDTDSWNLISSLDSNDSTISSRTVSPFAMGDGMVVTGNPEDDSNQSFAGSVQFFYNSAWQSRERFELAPIIDGNSSTQFSTAEDSSGFLHDFNGSHPFDSNNTWSIAETNASISSYEINATSGVFSFVPDANFSGNLFFRSTFTGMDGSDEHNFSINVIGAPDAPIFSNPAQFTLPDAMVGDAFSVTLELFDADGDSLGLSGSGFPDGLSVSGHLITGTPSVSSVAAEDGNYTDYNFSLEVSDGGLSSSASFSLRVYKRNNPPSFEDSFGNAITNLDLNFTEDFSSGDWLASFPDLSLNDPDGEVLSLSEVPGLEAQHGTLELNANATVGQQIIYLPDEDYYGDDNFSIRLTDSNHIAKSVDLNVSVRISAINDDPVITSFPSSMVANEGVEYLYQITFTDVDDSNDSLSLSVSDRPDWLSFDLPNNQLRGTPSWSDYSPSSINLFITVTDAAGAKDTQGFPLFVDPLNYPPVIDQGASLSYTISEDNFPTAWTSVSLSFTDTDTNKSSSSWSLFTDAAYGKVTLLPSGNDLDVDYEPDGNFSGIDSFSVVITDLADTNAKDVIFFEVNVDSVEDPPVFTTTPIYTDAVVGHKWEYSFSFADADANQTVSPSYDGSVAWLSLDDSNDSWTGKISGTPLSSDVTTSSLITLALTDSVGEQSEQAIVVQVLSDNTPPLIDLGNGMGVIMDEDTVWTLDSSLTVTETNNQKLTWSIHQDPTHGEAELNSTNEIIHSLIYVPSSDYFGNDSLIISVSDGIDEDLFTLDFEVQDVPDSPSMSDLSDDSLEDGNLYHKVINFTDPDGLSDLNYTITGLPGWVVVNDDDFYYGSVSLSGSPTVSEEGVSHITFLLSDSNGLQISKSFSLTAFVLNYPPVFKSDSFSITMTEDLASSWVPPFFDINDTETTLANLTWSVSSAPSHGQVSLGSDPQSEISYQPDENFFGSDSFTITVTDRSENNDTSPKSTSAVVNVTVTEINDKPIFTSTPTTNSAERYAWNDESAYIYVFQVEDPDLPDGESLTVEWASSSPMPSWLRLSYDENGTASLLGTATVADEGSYDLKFKVVDTEDSSLYSIHEYTFFVIIDDYPPVLLSPINQSSLSKIRFFTKEDAVHNSWIGPSGFYGINPDPEDYDYESLNWTIETNSSVGSLLQVFGSGNLPTQFDYQPPEDFHGVDTFSLRMDEGDRFSILDFEVHVSSQPDPPIFQTQFSDDYYLNAGEPFEMEINATDPDSSQLQFRLFGPAWDSQPWLTILGTDPYGIRIGGIPQIGLYGNEFPFSIFVLDETGRSSSVSVNFHVQGGNIPPTINMGVEQSVVFDANGTPLSFSLGDLIATDPDSTNLTWDLVPSKLPRGGQASIVGIGSSPSFLSYIPGSIEVDEDEFSIRVTDGSSYDEIRIKAIISWEVERPILSSSQVNEVTEVTEGESFATEVSIFYQDSREKFKVQLVEGPSWVSVGPIHEDSFFIKGEAPLSQYDDFELKIRVSGERSLSADLNHTIRVTDGTPPHLKLLGDRYLRLAKDELFGEPGYTATDQDGTDLTDSVIVDSVTGGFQKINYVVQDDAGNESRSYRLMNKYLESPLELNRTLVLSGEGEFGLGWGEGEEIFLWASSMDRLLNEESNYTYSPLDSNFTAVKVHKYRDSTEEGLYLDGNQVSIYDCIEQDNARYWLGSFNGELSVLGKRVVTDANQSCFLLKTTKTGVFEWLQTLDAGGTVSSLKMTLDSTGKVLLAGSYSGSFSYRGNLIFEVAEKDRVFLCAFSSEGELDASNILEAETKEKLVGLEVISDGSMLLLCQGFGSNTLGANNPEGTSTSTESSALMELSSGRLIKLDSQLYLTAEITFEGGQVSMRDLAVFDETIYLSGDYQGDFLVDQTKYFESTGRVGFLLKFSSAFQIDWARQFEFSGEASLVDISMDAIGDPYCVLAFKGSFVEDPEVESMGGMDILLTKVKSSNGKTLWTKQIGGAGEEEFLRFSSNSVGAVCLMLRSDSSLVLDEKFVPSVSQDEVLILNFAPTSGDPIVSFDPLLLQVEKAFVHSLSVPHPDYLFYKFLDAPSWMNLLVDEDSNGNAILVGTPPVEAFPDDTNGTLTIRIYNAEGGFSDEEISYDLNFSNANLTQFGYLPQASASDESITFGSNGQMVGILYRPEQQGVVVVGNFRDQFSLQGFDLQATSRSEGFIAFLDHNLSVEKVMHLTSSDQVTLTDSKTDGDGNIYLYGTFTGEIRLGAMSGVSLGGSDLCLIKINPSGGVEDLRTLGGAENEFSGAMVLGSQEAFLSGSFSKKASFGSTVILSKGHEDAFVLSLKLDDLNELNWCQSFGGTGVDRMEELTLSSNEKLLAGGTFHGLIEINDKQYDSGGVSGVLAIVLNRDGEILSKNAFLGSGNVANCISEWNPVDQSFILGGEFVGSLAVDQNQISSKGGKDLFVAKLSEELTVENLLSLGGVWNDRILDMNIDAAGGITLSGTFYEEIILGDQVYQSAGSKNAFLVKLDTQEFAVLDSFHWSSIKDDRIDQIASNTPEHIYFGGLSQTGNHSQANLFIYELGNKSMYPVVITSLPKQAWANLAFDFSLVTGGWANPRAKFSLAEQNGTDYSWLQLSVNETGVIRIWGTAPSEVGQYPVSFLLSDSNGGSLSVDFLLSILEINSSPPTIFSETDYEIFQFLNFEDSFELFDRDGDSLLIEVNAPKWVEWTWSDEMYFKISGLPPEGSLGSHDVTVSATDSAGLSTVANLHLKVKPRFVRTVNAAVSYDFELENWFGDFHIMDSGWCYHLDLGWIYLVPNQSGKQLWFWKKDWGWSWTSKEHWFASRQSGYLYIDQIQAWVYFTTSSNYTTARAYLYSQMKWVVYSSGFAQ
ncbi:MAG: hypothetical protein CBC00_09935 [Verrucomicrobia bacterium TMED40]|nr:MAG: hypothetical protein CBC00_09935 [Verrucomicrobia bacterium TMED40]